MVSLIDLEVYKVALLIGEKVWEMVNNWDYFNKDTLGKQFVKAADSMALNIAEGYGRFFFKENKNFNYYSRGSAFESTACLRKALQRNLIGVEDNNTMRQLFERFFRLMNGYIKSIVETNSKNELKEEQVLYGFDKDEDKFDNLLTNNLLNE